MLSALNKKRELFCALCDERRFSLICRIKLLGVELYCELEK
jgi:hypothetical protein